MDFFRVKQKDAGKNRIEIYPDFSVGKSKDLMIRGKSFYAIWDEEKGLWSTDEYDVQRLVDKELQKYYDEHRDSLNCAVHVRWMSSYSSSSWKEFKKYVQALSDNYKQLDTKIIFSNTEVTRSDFASMKLPYPLKKCSIKSYNELMDTLYSEDERRKIEWAIGSIIAGDSKNIQKFLVFYGEPGTGKTESVMQIAKETGRAVMHVDISNTKSMWFGESEKIIKQIFADYRRLCERSKVKPILLFNEADAIFSKRKDVSRSNVAQTENAIQNIILEEMENLDGILVATTNLADNFDAAFERRFLFKVRFDKPTIEAKKSIWMNKLSMLTDAEAQMLAVQFDMSGGQIDNIVRKVIMNEIVKGETPTLAGLKTLCAEEKLNCGNLTRIGFC